MILRILIGGGNGKTFIRHAKQCGEIPGGSPKMRGMSSYSRINKTYPGCTSRIGQCERAAFSGCDHVVSIGVSGYLTSWV